MKRREKKEKLLCRYNFYQQKQAICVVSAMMFDLFQTLRLEGVIRIQFMESTCGPLDMSHIALVCASGI